MAHWRPPTTPPTPTRRDGRFVCLYLAQGVGAQGRVQADEQAGGAEPDGDADGHGREEEEEGAEACFCGVGFVVGWLVGGMGVGGGSGKFKGRTHIRE